MTCHRYNQIIQLIDGRQPACGSTTVVAIDGPSGAGKTRFVGELAQATGADVLHLEDLYPGWHGLAATPPLVADVLAAIAVGGVGTAPRWDWGAATVGEAMHVPPTRLLLLDGVGSGAAVIRPHLSLLLWLEAPTAVRKERALARDGGAYEAYWDMWAEQEAKHFAAEGTRGHADLVIAT